MVKRENPLEYLAEKYIENTSETREPKEKKQTKVIREFVPYTNQNKGRMVLLAGMFCLTITAILAMYFYKK